MQEKEQCARTLLERGLTVRQISGQLQCSEAFVRRVRKEHEEGSPPSAG
jgi:transposase-like protein